MYNLRPDETNKRSILSFQAQIREIGFLSTPKLHVPVAGLQIDLDVEAIRGRVFTGQLAPLVKPEYLLSVCRQFLGFT